MVAATASGWRWVAGCEAALIKFFRISLSAAYLRRLVAVMLLKSMAPPWLPPQGPSAPCYLASTSVPRQPPAIDTESWRSWASGDLSSFGALKAGTKVSTHTTVSSVQMLALQLQFGVRSEVKMLPSFLRCFPRVETLVVESLVLRDPTSSNLSPKIRQETSAIECIQSHLKTLAFHEVQGDHNEFEFLTFIAENAPKLESMFIVMKNGLTDTEKQVAIARLGALCSGNWACKDCKVQLKRSCYPIGGGSWSLQAGSDLSVDDPFEAFPEE